MTDQEREIVAALRPLSPLLDQRLRELIAGGVVRPRPGGRLWLSIDPVSFHVHAAAYHAGDDDPAAGPTVEVLRDWEIDPVREDWERRHPEVFEVGLFNAFSVAVLRWLAERWAAVGGGAAYPGAFANVGCSEDESPFDLDSRRFFPWNDYF